MAWRSDAGHRHLFRPGYHPDPAPLLEHVAAGGLVVAHGAMFERTIWNENLRRTILRHWPPLRIEQQDCTMARACVLSLPAKLEDVCAVLKLPVQKDMEGSRLMRQMMKPRGKKLCVQCNGTGQLLYGQHCATCDGTGDVLTWWDDEPRRDRLDDYCMRDVDAEWGLDERLPALSKRERDVWVLDQQINDRGVHLDRPMIEKMQQIVVAGKITLDRAMEQVTGGAIKSCGQAKALASWITGHGVLCDSVAAENHDDILQAVGAHPCKPQIEAALDLRAEAGSVSAIKFPAMLDTLDVDDRSRGLLAYHATLQGRWAGRLWQPQNVKTREDEEVTDAALAMRLAESIPNAATVATLYDMIFDAPIGVCSLAQRSMITAAPGCELVGGDKSNIEGRVNAWLNGESWKIHAFREYDAGIGPDLYRVAYASSFGVDVSSVTGASRQVGKVQELALGYQGSVGAYVKMAKKKKIKLSRVRDTVKAAASPDEWFAAMGGYKSARNKAGLDQETWAAVAIVVKRWRSSNSCIVQGWWDLQDAAILAVEHPGEFGQACDGKIRYLSARDFLWCALPSGRTLAYYKPRVEIRDESYFLFPDGRREPTDTYFDFEHAELFAQGVRLVSRKKNIVTFEHQNDVKMWVREALYGGMQMAHVVSGIARDCMVEDMFNAEAAGFNTILTVHDELLTENPIGARTPEELTAILTKKPAWIVGDLPLAAKCWKGQRYPK